jgi:PST family polysaccharide transporter/lipopolysaccharide exporter
MKRGEIARSVTRGAFYLSVEKAAALVSGIVYFALLLRWLGPTKYGIMTLALSFAGLATMATGNLEVYLERFAAEHQARGTLLTLRRAHHLALLVKLTLGVLASGLLAALAPTLAHQFDAPDLARILPLLTWLVAFDGLSTTGRATLYGLQQFRWVSGIAVLFHVVKTVMVGFLWWSHQGLIALALGLSLLAALQGLAAGLVPLWMLRHATDPDDVAPPAGRSLLRSMIAYCAPLLGARATFLSGQNLGKIVLGKLFEPILLGYFSFAFQTVERFVELAHTLPSSLMPSLTQLVARAERERLRFVFDQAHRLIQVTACALSFGLFVFAREITLWVGSPLFEPAVPLLRILALVPIARTAQQPLTMLFQALNRPGVVLRLSLLKFVTEFGCYFAIVPTLGLAGAGWANLAGAVVSYVAALVALLRWLPEGGIERARAAAMSCATLLPLLLVAWAAESWLPSPLSLALRIGLVPVAGMSVFALRLVTRYDLEKLASVPLPAPWMRWARDGAVAAADRVVRALEPRSV